jgi:predicted DsbA family dithiol-disulfide isomerase
MAEPTATVEAVLYTDPLCSWSWAFEAPARRLRYELGEQLAWHTVLGGLLPDWETYRDPLNDIGRPVQMGPSWREVHHLSGMPLDETIWLRDPPASSYPASVAVKAAERQGRAAGEAYLRRAREAVMLEQRNIARREVLLALADELAARSGGSFDADRFHADLDGEAALDAFREDLKDVRFRGIGRFPTLLLRLPAGPERRGLIQVGYRPYSALRAALAQLAPDLEPRSRATDAAAYAVHWRGVTAREAAEALEIPTEAAERSLAAAVAAGNLERRGCRGSRGWLYAPPEPVPAVATQSSFATQSPTT